MKILKTWKEKRKAKQEAKDPYLVQEIRLNLKLRDLEPGTEEYEKIQQELKATNLMRADSRESKRRISKSDKGGIVIKLLGILGAGAGLGSIIWAEHKGLTFTGEKRSVMDSIARGIGQIFVRH